MRTLNDLFEETLKDVYFAENAILKALPKMAQKASSQDLKAAFTEHAQETEGQVKRAQHGGQHRDTGRAARFY